MVIGITHFHFSEVQEVNVVKGGGEGEVEERGTRSGMEERGQERQWRCMARLRGHGWRGGERGRKGWGVGDDGRGQGGEREFLAYDVHVVRRERQQRLMEITVVEGRRGRRMQVCRREQLLEMGGGRLVRLLLAEGVIGAVGRGACVTGEGLPVRQPASRALAYRLRQCDGTTAGDTQTQGMSWGGGRRVERGSPSFGLSIGLGASAEG